MLYRPFALQWREAVAAHWLVAFYLGVEWLWEVGVCGYLSLKQYNLHSCLCSWSGIIHNLIRHITEFLSALEPEEKKIKLGSASAIALERENRCQKNNYAIQ